jgi:hypothetical protein
MKRFARWLAFFAMGDLLMALGAAVAAVLCALAVTFLGAVWDSGLDATMAGSLFKARLDRLPSPAMIALVCLILPWPRCSLDNDGWRFWRWRGQF